MKLFCLYLIPIIALLLVLQGTGKKRKPVPAGTYYPDPKELADWLCYLHPGTG